MKFNYDITKYLEEGHKAIGVTFNFQRLVSKAHEDNVYGEDPLAITIPLFSVTGIMRSNPPKEQISEIGIEHKIDTIFNVTSIPILDYCRGAFPLSDNTGLEINDDHYLTNLSGDVILTLKDSIEYKGLIYTIENIIPHTTYQDQITMVKFECRNVR